jgi:hypothetical protein
MPQQYFLISQSGTPIQLPLEKHFTIGRSAGNDITLEDSRASRRHAELYFDGTDFIFNDMGSSNGSFVNGKRTHSTTLSDHDEVTIGLHTYVYRRVSDASELESIYEIAKDSNRQMATQEMPNLQTLFPPDSDFNGTLATLSIADLCQLLNHTRRNGLLVVQASKGKALVYFSGGEAVQAEYATFIGDEALTALLAEESGHFSFKKEKKPIEKNVKSRLAHLLLEAARLKDEGAA